MNLVEAMLPPAAEAETKPASPGVLYHGTGPATAAMIVASGVIKATEPVDDEHGRCVCTSASQQVAHDFACEYARLASPYDVGFIFTLNGSLIAQTCEVVGYEAETASSDEQEFRVLDDLPLKRFVTGLQATGDVALLSSASFRKKVYEEACDDVYDFRRTFPTYRDFSAVLSKMMRRR